ncbi:MAG: uncharacterized protein A8A55_0114, partial [Amphiamblys sp. WSBS2006]
METTGRYLPPTEKTLDRNRKLLEAQIHSLQQNITREIDTDAIEFVSSYLYFHVRCKESHPELKRADAVSALDFFPFLPSALIAVPAAVPACTLIKHCYRSV